jgi:hypothetical protein
MFCRIHVILCNILIGWCLDRILHHAPKGDATAFGMMLFDKMEVPQSGKLTKDQIKQEVIDKPLFVEFFGIAWARSHENATSRFGSVHLSEESEKISSLLKSQDVPLSQRSGPAAGAPISAFFGVERISETLLHENCNIVAFLVFLKQVFGV